MPDARPRTWPPQHLQRLAQTGLRRARTRTRALTVYAAQRRLREKAIAPEVVAKPDDALPDIVEVEYIRAEAATIVTSLSPAIRRTGLQGKAPGASELSRELQQVLEATYTNSLSGGEIYKYYDKFK